MDKFTHCVKCGGEKTSALECPSCGAIYAKAERLYKKPPPKMQPCPSCGQDVSVNAPACPHCGEPQITPIGHEIIQNQSQQKIRLIDRLGWQGVVVAVVVTCFFVFIAATDYRNAHSKDNKADLKKHVSQTEYGESWPYSIPEGRLNCVSIVVGGYTKQYVTIEYGGVVYAINGLARTSEKYAPLESIWLDDPKYPGTKVPDPGIVNLGLKLCN